MKRLVTFLTLASLALLTLGMGVAGAQAYPPDGPNVSSGAAASSGSSGSGLAFTGGESADLAIFGAIAVVIGLALVLVTLRRRSQAAA